MTYVQSKWGMSEPWMTFSWNSAIGSIMKLDVQVLGMKVVTLFWDPDEYVVQ